MWARWNTRWSENNPAKQFLCHRKPIQHPPTRVDVIKETMHQSHVTDNGCGQDYDLVTYDLITVKIANSIRRNTNF